MNTISGAAAGSPASGSDPHAHWSGWQACLAAGRGAMATAAGWLALGQHRAANPGRRQASRVGEGAIAGPALLDSLTRLPRQSLFMDHLRQLQVQQNQGGQAVVLLFIGLEGLNRVSDTRGHLVADMALTQVADLLRRSIRAGDVVGRHGADEFVIAVGTTAGQAHAVATRIATQVIDGVGQLHQGMGCSVGMGHALAGEGDAEGLLQRADAAMRLARGQGGNQGWFAGAEPVPPLALA